MSKDTIYFRFIELFHELYVLEQFILSLEPQMPELIRREKEKKYTEIKNKGHEKDQDVLSEITQQLHEWVEEILPRYFWGPVLVSLWAIFESGLIETAKEVQDQQKQIINLDDIRGNILERSYKYLNHILKIDLGKEYESWDHIKMFYVVRNALAHSNGRLENIRNE